MPHEVYDAGFFDYNDRVAAESAARIVPVVRGLLPEVASVADFGCARGIWLAAWQAAGVDAVCGVDGSYVDCARLRIPEQAFVSHDLAQPLDLGRRFDLVQSLEVAEHLPPATSRGFVRTLTAHGSMVLFSAAPPGQGGADHINERPYGFWRDLFAAEGYAAFDCLRPKLAQDRELQPWYRFNVFLYVHRDAVPALPQAVRVTEIAAGMPMPDVSPFAYQLRKRVVRLLPGPVQTGIAAVLGSWRAARTVGPGA